MNQHKNLKVGIDLVSPFVIKSETSYSGFEMELWDKVAHILGIEYTVVELPVTHLFNELVAKKIDIALGALTENQEREKRVDFSHHTFDGGLQILVHKNRKKVIFSTIKHFFFSHFQPVMLLLIAGLILFAHLYWFLERGLSVSANYLYGIGDSFWWLFVSITTVGYGDVIPQSLMARIVTVVVVLFGFSVFGLLVGHISSLLTLESLKGDLNGVRDLPGKKVATLDHSTSYTYLKNLDVEVVKTRTLEDALKKLYDRQVDAVVYDAPILQYHMQKFPHAPFQLIGAPFYDEFYAFALSDKSRHLEDINQAILALRDSGDYDMLYQKWFGKQ